MESFGLQAQYLSESCKSLIAQLNASELQHDRFKALERDMEEELQSKETEVGPSLAYTALTIIWRHSAIQSQGYLNPLGQSWPYLCSCHAASDTGVLFFATWLLAIPALLVLCPSSQCSTDTKTKMYLLGILSHLLTVLKCTGPGPMSLQVNCNKLGRKVLA